MTHGVRVLALGENEFDFHRIEGKAPILEAFLGGDDRVDLDVSTDRDRLRADRIREFDVYLDYLTDHAFTDAQMAGLREFVADGGGYVGVHCATDVSTFSEEPQADVEDLVGGRFLGHPERTDLDVTVVDGDHPVTRGVGEFSVFDEPYRLRWRDDVHVLAEMDHPEAGDHPAAWVRTHGDGRVFYVSLGHTDEAFEHDAFQRLVVRGTLWAAGRDPDAEPEART